jgi:hypothetical protein
MTVEELSALHRRYIDVSDRFKSAWTFHQFLQGLQKLTTGGELAQYATEFQAVYGLLKEVSQHLTATSTERVRNELEMVERRLGDLNRWLLGEDTKIPPSQLRVFFQRVRNYNEGILVQLIKFYLYVLASQPWLQDHQDKLDFLVTKVAEEAQGPQGPWVVQEPGKLRTILQGLWALVGVPEPDAEELADRRIHLEEMRRRMLQSESFEQLSDEDLIAEYRRFKFELGRLFFHPELLLAAVETNLALRNHIQQLYRREEQRIVADYHRIFELERTVSVDTQLDLELAAFKQEVESFERNLANESLSLEELRRVRQHVRDLVPRLTRMQEVEPLLAQTVEGRGSGPVDDAVPAKGAIVQAGPGSALAAPGSEELLREHHEGLVAALEGVSFEVSPRVAAFSPELFPYRLEAREVVAFRRLARGPVHGEPGLDGFLLWSAALRARIQAEVEEIRSILDDTAVTRDAPVFGQAAKSTALADLYVRRFEHEIEQAILQGAGEEARELLTLKMRLVRESAGLWLLVHKP